VLIRKKFLHLPCDTRSWRKTSIGEAFAKAKLEVVAIIAT
jgi:hypothetical protein